MKAAIHEFMNPLGGNMTTLPATFEDAQTVRRMAIELGSRLKRRVTLPEMLRYLIEAYQSSEQTEERLEA